MRTQLRSGGFTIIEVMLFLAVTGALTVALLVGSGVAINQQRYRDSINSFKGLIQEQYGQITNVINPEVENPACSPAGSEMLFNEETKRARGTSDCLILGRFLLIEPTTVTVYNLVGQPPADARDESDSTALSKYAFALQDSVTHEINWGARAVHPDGSGDSTTSIQIVRSPFSGSILTYVHDGDMRSNIVGMISDDNMEQKEVCLSYDGLSPLANRLAVRINARAANQSAVEIPLEKDKICK